MKPFRSLVHCHWDHNPGSPASEQWLPSPIKLPDMFQIKFSIVSCVCCVCCLLQFYKTLLSSVSLLLGGEWKKLPWWRKLEVLKSEIHLWKCSDPSRQGSCVHRLHHLVKTLLPGLGRGGDGVRKWPFYYHGKINKVFFQQIPAVSELPT